MIKKTFIGLYVVVSACTGFAQAEGSAGSGKEKAEICAGCHGEDGNASAPIFPKLAGQHASYLSKQLSDYKSKKRRDPTMNAMAESLSDADIADLGAWFSKHRIRFEQAEPNPLGEKIYRAGNAGKGIPACTGCHGPGGEGNPNAVYPALGGQYSAYIGKALHDFKAGERDNDPNEIMRAIAGRLSEQEIDAVADYIYGLR